MSYPEISECIVISLNENVGANNQCGIYCVSLT